MFYHATTTSPNEEEFSKEDWENAKKNLIGLKSYLDLTTATLEHVIHSENSNNSLFIIFSYY